MLVRYLKRVPTRLSWTNSKRFLMQMVDSKHLYFIYISTVNQIISEKTNSGFGREAAEVTSMNTPRTKKKNFSCKKGGKWKTPNSHFWHILACIAHGN